MSNCKCSMSFNSEIHRNFFTKGMKSLSIPSMGSLPVESILIKAEPALNINVALQNVF